LYLVRLSRELRRPREVASQGVPTHVRELDIRPQSLPADIGAAARDLWQKNERRAALSLLYRGLLSRLVHVHGIAIRESSTEGDCLRLLSRRPEAYRNEYATRLVRIWERAVYGAQDPEDAAVLELCENFGPALNAPSAGHEGLQPA
jgi:hypothetical protein